MPGRRKKRSKSNKGGNYERAFCKMLSRWWTRDSKKPMEDVFWRTSGSGARATVRSRRGQRTFGSYGDIGAIHPCGDLLMDLFCVELKKGYNRNTILDLMELPPKSKEQKYEEWFLKTVRSWKKSGTFAWLIIHKRDHREALVYFPPFLWEAVDGLLEQLPADITPNNSYKLVLPKSKKLMEACSTTLTTFLETFTPSVLKELAKRV